MTHLYISDEISSKTVYIAKSLLVSFERNFSFKNYKITKS